MNRWVPSISIAFLYAVIMVGCSGGDIQTPISPDPAPQVSQEPPPDLTPEIPRIPDSSPDVKNYLWGYYDCYLDTENNTVEAVPNRNVMFNANVVQFLNANPAFFTFDFVDINGTASHIDVDIDVSIKHPFGGAEKFNGYDVRCVFIGYGSAELQSNGLKYPVFADDMHMRDDPFNGDGGGPDGYTRWFNPTEFTTPGLLGYTHGTKAFMDDLTNTATLCPYKYYTDFLDPNDDVITWLDNYPENYGVFSAGFTNTRNFFIRFPTGSGLKWAYAVVASWAGGQPDDHPANTTEAVACDITDNSILFYEDDIVNGGIFDLDIKLYGWGEAPSSITIESTALDSPYIATTEELIPVTTGENWAVYHLSFPAGTISGLSGNEMWIMPGYDPADYSNAFGVSNDATGPLTSYFRFPLGIGNEAPPCDPGPEIVTDDLDDAYVGVEYYLQFTSTGGDGNLTWSLGPGSVLPDGLIFSPSGSLSGAPAEGSNGVYSDIVFKVQDECIAGAQVDTVSLGMIVFDPEITIISPNGGEVWPVGSSHEFTWMSDDVYTNVDILYSKDNFNMDFQVIAQNEENDGGYQWDPIPEDPSDTVHLRIQSTTMPQYYDDSDAEFSITGGYIEVLDPNGGENLSISGNYEILWDSQYVIGNVNIWYSKDNFVSDFQQIALFDPNDGSFLWEDIPDDPSSTVRIRVQSIYNLTIYDDSDADFTISAIPLSVLTPNGGEEYWYGTDEDITWTTGGVTGNVDIRYSTDNFTSDVNVIADNTPNDGIQTWENIPMEFTDTLKVRVRSHDDPGFYDDSDANFSIVDHGWAKTWGEATNDTATAVATDSAGNIYISGRAENHCMLAKFNNYGEQEWQKEWGNAPGDTTVDIALDGSGNIYLVGVFSDAGPVDFDPGPGTEFRTNAGVQDCFLVSYTPDGNLRFVSQWGGSDADYVNGIDVTWGGTCFVVGEIIQTVDFDPSGVEYFLTPDGFGDAYIARYNDGELIWAKNWGCDGATITDSDKAMGVCIDGIENYVYVTGCFGDSSTVDFDPGIGNFPLTSNGGYDIFLTRFWLDGNFSTAYSWGGESDLDCGYDIAIYGDSVLHVCGQVYGTDVDMDPTGGTDTQSSVGTKGNSFITKFNSPSGYGWSRIWGGGPGAFSDDQANSLEVGNSGDIFVTGNFHDVVDFDPGGGVNEHTAPSWPTNAYVTKFNSAGDHQWANTIGGADAEEGLGITITSDNVAYAVGFWGSTPCDFAPNDGSCGAYTDEHTILGSFDCFLVKYMPDGCW